MPVHFNSFVGNEIKETELLSSILTNDVENPNSVFISCDKKSIHSTKYIIDDNSKEKIGKTVVTMKVRKKEIELVDADIIILNNNPITLTFIEKLPESSEANEYYEVSTIGDERHFQIETVNHYFLEGKNIIGTNQTVSLSIFPFRLNIYNNIDEFNKEFGFAKPIKLGESKMEVYGYAEDFVAVGEILIENYDEPCSMIIGKVDSFKDVDAIIGGMKVHFIIIQLKTALGTLPVAVSKDNFDLNNLEIDKTVVMFANVKADFIK